MQRIKLKEFIVFYKVLKNLKSRNTPLYYDLLKRYGDFYAEQRK